MIDIGDAELRYRGFLNDADLNFVIVAFVLFLVIKAYNRAFPKKEDGRRTDARSSCSPRSGTSCAVADPFRV